MFTVGIDPGLRIMSWAVAYGDTILRAGFVQGGRHELGPAQWRTLFPVTLANLLRGLQYRLVLEVPRVYPAAERKGDQNDLIQLMGAGAFVAGQLLEACGDKGDLQQVYPRDWKGQVPKQVMTARIRSKLTLKEIAAVSLPSAQSLHHNVWDSVGIVLWRIGRLGRMPL
jgi:hypothetical protein